jgi:cell division protein FtsX
MKRYRTEISFVLLIVYGFILTDFQNGALIVSLGASALSGLMLVGFSLLLALVISLLNKNKNQFWHTSGTIAIIINVLFYLSYFALLWRH